MSSSVDEQSTEKEVVINGKSDVDEELTVMESRSEPQCAVTENAPPEAAQTESVSDWLVMICVFLCYLLNGINVASYGVLYLPLTEMFQASRAAVGWIISLDVALGSFLGEMNMFVTVVVLTAAQLSAIQF